MPAERDMHPFSIPHIGDEEERRSSVSSASTFSDKDSDETRVSYKDDVRPDNLHTTAARHQYPPLIQSKRNAKEGGDDEADVAVGEDEEDLLDEEERVGLMMQSKHAKSHSKTARCWPCLPARFLPFAISMTVLLAIALLVPTLGWLATASRTVPLQKSDSHLTQVLIPPYWSIPNQPAPSAHQFKKIKHPLPPGVAKMKSFGPPFTMDFAVDGPERHENVSSLLPISMDSVFDGTFRSRARSLRWCPEDPDEGVFITTDIDGDLILEDVTHLRKDITGQGEVAKGGGKVKYVAGADVTDGDGRRLDFVDYKLSPDMQQILFFTEKVAQWRHSSFSKLWLHDVSSKTTRQLGFSQEVASISTAEWTRKGHRISFVEGNNLYVIPDARQPENIRNVTTTGNANIFNGIPDWVYEEEVLSGDSAHWWSPDGNRIAYFELDETAVKTYSFPIYNPTDTNGKASLYPQSVNMKYPKPGTPNPIISVWVYDARTDKKYELTSPPASTSRAENVEDVTADFALRAAGEDILVTQLNWVNSHTVLMRETNRWSDAMRFLVFDCLRVKPKPGSGESVIEGSVSRRVSTTKSGGWVQAEMDVHVVDEDADSTAYVDVVALKKDYRHIAYFDDATRSEPIFLTKGAWEVDEILFVGNNRVYFTAAYPNPAFRHILYVDIPANPNEARASAAPSALTDTAKAGFFKASFDPKGNYFLLDKQGPEVPSSRVLSLRDPSFELVLEDNEKLVQQMAKYVHPQKVFYNITTHDGSTISVSELRPYDFDESGNTRYPVLIHVYGGPMSQQVQATFDMANWHTYLACSLSYIVVTMDGRGTGFKGRTYRDTVTWRLGEMESRDVVEGAQAIRRLPYVSQSKIGIWGWSYGGYLTAKVIEKDSGAFDLGMSVAPVTRWEFYDSVYTERYMKTPHLNKGGYENSSIHVTNGFRNSHFLLAQGSGDDNVHFQNSAHMLDMLQGAKIRDFWFEMFPDSTHSINKRGANRELYEFLTRFLVYNWGAGGKRLLRNESRKDGS